MRQCEYNGDGYGDYKFIGKNECTKFIMFMFFDHAVCMTDLKVGVNGK